jgi:hypothetical protein
MQHALHVTLTDFATADTRARRVLRFTSLTFSASSRAGAAILGFISDPRERAITDIVIEIPVDYFRATTDVSNESNRLVKSKETLALSNAIKQSIKTHSFRLNLYFLNCPSLKSFMALPTSLSPSVFCVALAASFATSFVPSSTHVRICFKFLLNIALDVRTSDRIRLATASNPAAVITKFVHAIPGASRWRRTRVKGVFVCVPGARGFDVRHNKVRDCARRLARVVDRSRARDARRANDGVGARRRRDERRRWCAACGEQDDGEEDDDVCNARSF